MHLVSKGSVQSSFVDRRRTTTSRSVQDFFETKRSPWRSRRFLKEKEISTECPYETFIGSDARFCGHTDLHFAEYLEA